MSKPINKNNWVMLKSNFLTVSEQNIVLRQYFNLNDDSIVFTYYKNKKENEERVLFIVDKKFKLIINIPLNNSVVLGIFHYDSNHKLKFVFDNYFIEKTSFTDHYGLIKASDHIVNNILLKEDISYFKQYL